MSAAKKTAGPSSARVAANVRRLRTEQQLSTYELARLLGEAGWPIGAGGITRIEGGDRRVDADDLVALAAVFGVSPNVLLLPESRSPLIALQAEVELAPNVVTNLGGAWGWVTGEMALRGPKPVTLHEEAQFALVNRPHRFALLGDVERLNLQVNDHQRFSTAIVRALVHRFTPWQIRTMFEQGLVAALNSYGDIPAPDDWSARELDLPKVDTIPPEAADGQG
jgi:transcriptional regulator with XRE-family HTH domain